MRQVLFPLVVAALTACSLSAQAGNEVIFVGTSLGGSTDPHYFAESGTGSASGPQYSTFTDNVTDAVWANQGRDLFVAEGLMNRIAHAAWNGSSATWSTLWSAPGACYGLGLDRDRQRLWTLSGATGGTRELYCIDIDASSATYGTVLAQTATLSGGVLERWELSRHGNYAMVPDTLLGSVQVIDTDPSSPTFLQSLGSVFAATGLSIAIGSDAAVSLDEQYGYVCYAGITTSQTPGGGIAVLHIPTLTWLDFDSAPGQQHFQIPLPVPNFMDLSLDRSFAVVSGQGGPGWAARIDFDYITPSNSTFTEYLPGQGLLPNGNGISLSPISDRVAVTATAVNLSAPSQLLILDATSGALLHNITLTGLWNVYTTAWQDSSPTATYTAFGAGCSGTLGVPGLAAAAGSRPALGSTFTAEVTNVTNHAALLATGFSITSAGGLPLPLDLGSFGMNGCFLRVDPIAVSFLAGAANVATWTWPVPSAPSFFGLTFYQQAFVLDGAANSAGLTASNGAAAVLGF